MIMMTSFAAHGEDDHEQDFSDQLHDETSQYEEPHYIEIDPIIPENVSDEPPGTEKHETDEELDLTLKMKLKEAAFGFPPAADFEDLKEKLNKVNNTKFEQIKILDAAAKEASVQKKLKDGEVDEAEVQPEEQNPASSRPGTAKKVGFVIKRSETPKKEDLLLADEDEQTIEFLHNVPESVAFPMQPEEDFTTMENVNYDVKFFFGSPEKPPKSQPPKATQQETKPDASKYFPLNDQSQSVFQLADESKLPHVKTEEEQQLDELEPLGEVLDDKVEELSKKIFEETKEEENLDTPTLIKLQENIAFQYSPKTGALKFEKRPSLPEEEKSVVEPEKAQNQKGKLRRSEGAEDLSVIGVNQSEPSQQNVKKQSEVSSVDPYKTGAIKKVYDEAQNKSSKIEPSYTTVDIEGSPGLRSVVTVSSLHEMVHSGQQERKPKRNEGDDDDGFINLVRKITVQNV
jgi:hypothetical protein